VVLLGAVLVAVLLVGAVLTGASGRGTLDPRGYDPDGAHALAVLLEQQGVDVRRTSDVPSTVQQADARTTVFVPLPSLLSQEELYALAGTPGRLVVAEASPLALEGLSSGADVVGFDETRDRSPGCGDEAATRAGRALMGGFAYDADGATACYRVTNGASLLRLGRVTLLGAADALTNDHLDEEGDAALALGLLGQDPRLLWLVPSPTRPAFGERPLRSPDDLVPHWLHMVRWQLLVAVVVLALWRGRRLGRVVLEQLPAVVRASETVEGHGRLSRAAGARDSAASALRESARHRLARLAHGGTLEPEALVGLVSSRTGRDAVSVRSLLYGPAPADDAALVRLAHALDELVRAALTREGATR
jgi:hypothetical protein